MTINQTKLLAAAKDFYEAVETFVDSMGYENGNFLITDFSFEELMKARKEFNRFL